MTHADISLNTKHTLVDSLKKFMRKKPLSRITISEICNDCGMNRKTFYYHFEDINDMLRWMLEQEALTVVKQFDLLADYEEVIRFIIDYVDANDHILSCVYDTMGREGMKRFFLSDFKNSISVIIEGIETTMNISISPGYKQFLCDFYTNALSGILLDWFLDRTARTKEEMIDYLALTVKTSLMGAVSAGMKR